MQGRRSRSEQLVVLERFIKHVLRFVARRAERQTIFQLAFIHDMQGCLDRDRIDLAEDRVDQRFQCDLRFGCLTDVAFEIIVDHAAVGCRDEIGNGRDAAATAQREDRHRLVIVAGINAEILTDVRGKPTDLLGMSWDEIDRANRLAELREQYPEAYQNKFNEKFGK